MNIAALKTPALLEESYIRQGFQYTLLHSNYATHLYEYRIIDGDSANQVHYEVVIAKAMKAGTFPNGRTWDDKWAIPSDTQWGTYGFTYFELDKAIAKYESLLERGKEIYEHAVQRLPSLQMKEN